MCSSTYYMYTRGDRTGSNVWNVTRSIETVKSSLETRLTGLSPFTQYRVSVAAVNVEDGREIVGVESQSITVTTLDEGLHHCVSSHYGKIPSSIICNCCGFSTYCSIQLRGRLHVWHGYPRELATSISRWLQDCILSGECSVWIRRQIVSNSVVLY